MNDRNLPVWLGTLPQWVSAIAAVATVLVAYDGLKRALPLFENAILREEKAQLTIEIRKQHQELSALIVERNEMFARVGAVTAQWREARERLAEVQIEAWEHICELANDRAALRFQGDDYAESLGRALLMVMRAVRRGDEAAGPLGPSITGVDLVAALVREDDLSLLSEELRERFAAIKAKHLSLLDGDPRLRRIAIVRGSESTRIPLPGMISRTGETWAWAADLSETKPRSEWLLHVYSSISGLIDECNQTAEALRATQSDVSPRSKQLSPEKQ